jgi:ribosome recycling factor
MAYDFTNFKKASAQAIEWMQKEYTSIRTSRAAPSILDSITVDAYGSKMPINQLATISIEGPKMLRLTPWDKGVAKPIDRAIREANLGLSVALDGETLRVSFPELTSERRVSLLKLAKEKLEDSRKTIRQEREKTLGDIDKKEKDGQVSEDEKFRLKNDLQKLVDEANQKLEELYNKKEKEIQE